MLWTLMEYFRDIIYYNYVFNKTFPSEFPKLPQGHGYHIRIAASVANEDVLFRPFRTIVILQISGARHLKMTIGKFIF